MLPSFGFITLYSIWVSLSKKKPTIFFLFCLQLKYSLETYQIYGFIQSHLEFSLLCCVVCRMQSNRMERNIYFFYIFLVGNAQKMFLSRLRKVTYTHQFHHHLFWVARINEIDKKMLRIIFYSCSWFRCPLTTHFFIFS